MEEDVTASVAMAVFGLDGFRVLAAEVGGQLELLVETAADLVGCPECGVVARPRTGARCGCATHSSSVGRW